MALACAPILGCRSVGSSSNRMPRRSGPASYTIALERGWLFGGKFDPAAVAPHSDETAFSPVTVPHCAAKLSWQKWDPASWQQVWIYRRHFTLPAALRKQRVFLHFEGVMVGATATINAHTLAQHLGGYLPFEYELTDHLLPEDNVLALAVDGRWLNVPPDGSPKGVISVDYLQPAGIHRAVHLQVVPPIYIRDAFAKPVQVLNAARRIEVTCTLDAAIPTAEPASIQVELKEGARVLSQTQQSLRLNQPGSHEVRLTLANLGNVALWDVDAPKLYEVVATLLIGGKPVHDYTVRTGLREARFGLDGFFLNGRRLQLFGLNRHEIYPYVGAAMPRRVLRQDAAILRHEFNCNIVRCSHYPQSADFLDACDELGLMVWEEIPGWQYIGDEAWQELAVRDVHDMIVRDRNRPSIVIWGTRINESRNDVALYRKTRTLAKALDDSRPSSGSMTPSSRKNWERDWAEDVFAFDDYHTASDGSVGIEDPVPGYPYLLAEAVGQYNYATGKGFGSKYRRAADAALQQQQALRHAQAHSKAAANPRICGVIAWCGFDYASMVNPFNNVKCPGVADVFRIPKLGATFYQAQIDPKARVVILPNFYWDFGPQTPRGPGKNAAIFSNCDRLEVFLNNQPHATLRPDAVRYPHLKHPPFFVDLELDGAGHPELRIDGYVGDRLALSRSFSSDSSQDQLFLKADHSELLGDGVDATRLVFKVVDKYGAERAFAGGEITFELNGPGAIVGDNPFSLADSGGVGAVWIRTTPNSSGQILVTARHSALGAKSVRIQVHPQA